MIFSRASKNATVILLLFTALAPGLVEAKAFCLVSRMADKTESHPVAVGDALTLTFLHSIYGSPVEERFRIDPEGLKTSELRYAELRLVEFYGHESAKLKEGWWVVKNPGRALQSLSLSASRESFIDITFRDQMIRLHGGEARLSLTACDRRTSG